MRVPLRLLVAQQRRAAVQRPRSAEPQPQPQPPEVAHRAQNYLRVGARLAAGNARVMRHADLGDGPSALEQLHEQLA